mmetsp:Transcript_64833/g.153273  ORF Transcript_64833/g.153273 Transcript_64833/m.153273 type:complete len:126 (+) Transcript_64833:351-728(+)
MPILFGNSKGAELMNVCREDICSMIEQSLTHSSVSNSSSTKQRGRVTKTPCIDRCTMQHQSLHSFHRSPHCSTVQCSAAIAPTIVRVGPVLKKKCTNLGVTFLRGRHEGGETKWISRCKGCPMLQ